MSNNGNVDKVRKIVKQECGALGMNYEDFSNIELEYRSDAVYIQFKYNRINVSKVLTSRDDIIYDLKDNIVKILKSIKSIENAIAKGQQ